jgi:hypothetical protein
VLPDAPSRSVSATAMPLASGSMPALNKADGAVADVAAATAGCSDTACRDQ